MQPRFLAKNELPADLWSFFRWPSPDRVEGPFFGVSGLPVWKITQGSDHWALKSLPGGRVRKTVRLETHRVLGLLHEKGLTCVPRPAPHSLIEREGTLWEALSWQPGTPLSPSQVTPDQKALGMRHLGSAHRILSRGGPRGNGIPLDQTPAWSQRLKRLRPLWSDFSPMERSLEQAGLGQAGWGIRLKRWMEVLGKAGQSLNGRVWAQRIHGDPHLGNWLGQSDRIGGWIDFGDGEKPDLPEVDIARFWGSWGGSQEELEGLLARHYQPASEREAQPKWIAFLEASGAVLRLAFWLERVGASSNSRETPAWHKARDCATRVADWMERGLP